MEFLFRLFKVFRLHVILHVAAGAVRAHSVKGPGYCYMIFLGPKSCLLSHATGLLFCLYVKVFLSSILNSVESWSSISCIVLDIEPTDKEGIEVLGVIIYSRVQIYSFRPPKKYKPTKQAFCCTRNLHGIVWKSGRLDYSELANSLTRAVNGEYFAKGRKKCNILGNLLDKEVEKLEDHGCPKAQYLVDEGLWISSSHPFRHKTPLHCAELVSNACAQVSPDNTLSSFTNFLPEQLNLEVQWEIAIWNYRTHQCTKMSRREIYVCRPETFKFVRFLLPEILSLPFHHGYCWSHEHSLSRKTQSQWKLYHS